MARYSISDTTLTALGDATRKATNTSSALLYTSFITPFPEYYCGWDSSGKIAIKVEADKYGQWPATSTWHYQVIELPEGIDEFHFDGGGVCDYLWGDHMWVAEGDQTGAAENPTNVILNFPEYNGNNNYSFTTSARVITFGVYCGTMISEPFYCLYVSGYGPKKYTPEEMATTISSLQTLSPELLHWTGDVTYKNYMGRWDNFIEYYGDKITTSDITAVGNFMRSSKLKRIPFEINCKATIPVSLDDCLNSCEQLTEAPIINNLQIFNYSSMFEKCKSLREFPEGYGEDWDWSYLASNTSSSYGQCDGIFANCYSLRKLPMGLFKYCSPKTQVRYSALRNLEGLYALDEITEFPLPHSDTVTGTGTSGAFYYTCRNCYRLKNFTFASDIGPKNWTNQTLDMTICVGWANYVNDCCNYNSGITMNKRVSDDASYQALKNDPDWFTGDMAYSRYNHDSAVATINSLPDCSAYQTTNNKAANIIKFKGAAGAKTDGGAINTLTDEEIAVATAKGWTVTLA